MRWGILDQVLSSGTNFGLTVLAAHLAHARGLGLVAVAFTTYILVLGLQRALVTEPLIVDVAHRSKPDKDFADSRALTMTLFLSVFATVTLVAIGLLVPGTVGHGIRLIAPWLVPCLLQDYWRSLLFRDQRGAAATCNDLCWTLVMVGLAFVAATAPSAGTALAAWAGGGSAAAVLGCWQVRGRAARLGPSLRWWWLVARPLGQALGVAHLLLQVGSQVTTVLLASLLSASGLGGIRGAESLFAPNTLVGQALAMPGLPRVSQRLRMSFARARADCLRISACALALLLPYLLIVGAFRGQLLRTVFGPEFVIYQPLLLPIAAAQIILAAGTGPALLARADKRATALIGSRALQVPAQILLVLLLTSRFGTVGAAWGLAIGSALGSVTLTAAALRGAGESLQQPAVRPPARPVGGSV